MDMTELEYIKWHWKHDYEDEPILLFYEVDLANERYATRLVEVFTDGSVKPYIEEGVEYVTEAPVPTVEEINRDEEFEAEIITKDEFERVYSLSRYTGD